MSQMPALLKPPTGDVQLLGIFLAQQQVVRALENLSGISLDRWVVFSKETHEALCAAVKGNPVAEFRLNYHLVCRPGSLANIHRALREMTETGPCRITLVTGTAQESVLADTLKMQIKGQAGPAVCPNTGAVLRLDGRGTAHKADDAEDPHARWNGVITQMPWTLRFNQAVVGVAADVVLQESNVAQAAEGLAMPEQEILTRALMVKHRRAALRGANLQGIRAVLRALKVQEGRKEHARGFIELAKLMADQYHEAIVAVPDPKNSGATLYLPAAYDMALRYRFQPETPRAQAAHNKTGRPQNRQPV